VTLTGKVMRIDGFGHRPLVRLPLPTCGSQCPNREVAMRPIRHIALLAVAAMAMTAPVAVADGPRGDSRARVVPAFKLAGDTAGELLGDWYVQNLSLPASQSPFAGSADLCLNLGHRGKVLSPSGGLFTAAGMTCTVKVNRPVLLVMTSADCSSAEPPPFFGRTAAEQRACAIAAITRTPEIVDVRAINVSMDGQPAIDIHSRRFFAVSPQRRVVFPPEPVFGATPGPATFVAAGWVAEIRGMDRGRHVMRAIVETAAGPLPEFIVNFDVVRGHHRDRPDD
jgi:hypothetical protein